MWDVRRDLPFKKRCLRICLNNLIANRYCLIEDHFPVGIEGGELIVLQGFPARIFVESNSFHFPMTFVSCKKKRTNL